MEVYGNKGAALSIAKAPQNGGCVHPSLVGYDVSNR